MNNYSNSNISTSSPSSSSMDFADRVLAPAVVTLLLLLVLVVAYLFAWRQQRVGVQLDEMATAATFTGDEDGIDEDEYSGVNEETVKSFPKLVYSQRLEFVRGETAVEEWEDSGTCSICLLKYKESDVIRMLPVCNHFFHQSCVDQWLKLHTTCPICRISLLRSTRRFRVIT